MHKAEQIEQCASGYSRNTYDYDHYETIRNVFDYGICSDAQHMQPYDKKVQSIRCLEPTDFGVARLAETGDVSDAFPGDIGVIAVFTGLWGKNMGQMVGPCTLA